MRPLEPVEVVRAASRLGFPLSPEESLIYAEAIQGLEEEFAQIPEGSSAPHSIEGRTYEFAPPPERNPFNSFLTQCLVKGDGTGPLAGVRVGLKDHISVAGVPMTLGTRFMEGYVPNSDATVVTRLLNAGAEIIGKLNMDDFSRPGHGVGVGIGDYGRCLNPHSPDHLSGGSSSGSAVAVACNAVDLSIGGDQGGSIRIPAAWCGVVGLKPTFGLIPHTGVVGIDPSIDHIGPMARTAWMVARALDCIAGPENQGKDPMPSEDPRSSQPIDAGIEGLRVGLLREGFGAEGGTPAVDEIVRAAVESLRRIGATVFEVSVPEHLTCRKLLLALSRIGSHLSIQSFGGVFEENRYDVHFIESFGRRLQARAELLSPPVKLTMLLGDLLGHRASVYYAKAKNARRAYRRAYDRLFDHVDCLAMPTVPITAPAFVPPKSTIEALQRALVQRHMRVVGHNTPQFNVTGHPALSVPCGFINGLPVAVMFVGPFCSDRTLLRVAYAYEHSADT